MQEIAVAASVIALVLGATGLLIAVRGRAPLAGEVTVRVAGAPPATSGSADPLPPAVPPVATVVNPPIDPAQAVEWALHLHPPGAPLRAALLEERARVALSAPADELALEDAYRDLVDAYHATSAPRPSLLLELARFTSPKAGHRRATDREVGKGFESILEDADRDLPENSALAALVSAERAIAAPGDITPEEFARLRDLSGTVPELRSVVEAAALTRVAALLEAGEPVRPDALDLLLGESSGDVRLAAAALAMAGDPSFASPYVAAVLRGLVPGCHDEDLISPATYVAAVARAAASALRPLHGTVAPTPRVFTVRAIADEELTDGPLTRL